MKKSVIYLSFAILLLNNIVIGSTNEPVSKFGLGARYDNTTPLAIAIAKGDLESVKKFIEYGADVNERSNDMTPLMIAARYNQVEIINLLIKNGANIKATNEKGLSALKYAELSNADEALNVLKQVLADTQEN
jgi:ankyrin repeat protein